MRTMMLPEQSDTLFSPNDATLKKIYVGKDPLGRICLLTHAAHNPRTYRMFMLDDSFSEIAGHGYQLLDDPTTLAEALSGLADIRHMAIYEFDTFKEFCEWYLANV